MGCQTSGYCIWKHADRELNMEENNASLFLCSLALRNPLSTMIWVCEFRWIQVHVIWEWLLLGTVTVWRFLKKLKMELPYDPTIALLGIYLKKTKTLIWTCISMVIAALFTTAKVWKQPKCPSTGEWMKKMWCIFCCCVVPKLCLIFCDPMDCSPPWDFPGKNAGVGHLSLLQGSSWPRDRTCVSCTGGQLLYHWATSIYRRSGWQSQGTPSRQPHEGDILLTLANPVFKGP